MKFIGHLDMMRYFQKAIRRANIDIAYSEGFSPHQVMSFAAPLGVGVTSDGEYLDIEVKSSKGSQEAMQDLNGTMAEGISILEYRKLPDTAKTAMSLVAAADYLVYPKPGCRPFAGTQEQLKDEVEAFYDKQAHISITKQTKKREIEMDLKPLIYEMKSLNLNQGQELGRLGVLNPQILAGHCPKEEIPALFLRLCTGSTDNVKPELALEAFCHFHGLAYEPSSFQVHRLEVYAKADEVPVKGEHERQAYAASLKRQREACRKKGIEFPRFLALGKLGRDIYSQRQK